MAEKLHHNEFNVENPFQKAIDTWNHIVKNPDEYIIKPKKPRRFRAAFGDGIGLFGGKNLIWDRLNIKGKTDYNSNLEIAGVNFTIGELKSIGDFYKYLVKTYQAKGVCIDERIDLNAKHNDSGIHEHCGAAAAIGQVIGTTGDQVENIAKEKLFEDYKAELITGMEKEHESLSVLIDFTENFYNLNPNQNNKLRNNAALPFQISLPLKAVESFANKHHMSAPDLLHSLLKWNLQIAINIMKGDHNAYHDVVKDNHKGIIVTTIGKDNHPLLNVFNDYLSKLQNQGQKITELTLK